MEVRLSKEPKLDKPVLLCGWSGIGNIGLIAVDSLRKRLDAEEFGEIESYNFFYPKKVKIEEGLLMEMEFPVNRFYSKKLETGDLIFFIGEQQPGKDDKVYRIGEAVLDIAVRFDCQRIYTSGAAMAQIHHQTKPRVWAVPNKKELIDEIKKYKNTVLMSEIEGSSDQGFITGLNGLMIGMAREKEMEAICLMGEFPVYIPHSLPYPMASISVLEVLTKILGINFDTSRLQDWANETEKRIEEFYLQIPDDMKERIEKLKYSKPASFTEKDGKKFVKEVEDFLKRSKEDGEIPL